MSDKSEILKPFSRKELWTSWFENKLLIEVAHWGVERENEFMAMNDGKGCWNYYVSIPERHFPEKFESLWLEDKPVKYFETSPERITHDYMNHPIAGLEWHCGVTYYEKEGQVKGHRAVKFGCDFSHYWDSKRGFDYTLEEVIMEAMETAKQILEYLTKP